MKGPLVIVPHAWSETVNIRAVELARGLSQNGDVYCLRFKDIVHADASNVTVRKIQQLAWGLKSLFPRVRVTHEGQLRYLEVPFVHPTFLQRLLGTRRAWRWACIANSRILKTTLTRLRPPTNRILLSSAYFDLQELSGFHVWLDLWDIHLVDGAPGKEQALNEFLGFVKIASRVCTGISVPNEYLQDWLLREACVRAEVVPNGAWVYRVRQLDSQAVARIRRSYSLENKWVVGYVGNHTASAGIDFFMDVARHTVDRTSEIAFMVVGPVDRQWDRAIATLRGHPQVVFTGPVARDEVRGFVQSIDVGVLCSPPRFRHRSYALPLKVVEYSAARKFIISTPLELIAAAQWPHVRIPQYDPAAWLETIQTLRSRSWEGEWDALVEAFDWSRVAEDLVRSLDRY